MAADFQKPLNLHKLLKAIDFDRWLEERAAELQPPVCIQQLWQDTDFIVSVVGGPVRRPLLGLTEAEKSATRAAFEACGLRA